MNLLIAVLGQNFEVYQDMSRQLFNRERADTQVALVLRFMFPFKIPLLRIIHIQLIWVILKMVFYYIHTLQIFSRKLSQTS